MAINYVPSEDLEWLFRGCGGSEIPRIKQKRKKINIHQFSSVEEAIKSSTKSTNLLIGLYRHVLIDLNIIRMIILSLYGAQRNITLENPKFEPESSKNYELDPNFNQQSVSQRFTNWIDHVQEFCSQEIIITPDHTTLDSIFKPLALSLKKDQMLSMLNWNAKNNLLLKRVKKWVKLLKPDITGKQYYPVCLKIVLCHLYSLMVLQCETSEGATLKELKKEYYQLIKSAKAGSTASTPGLSNKNQLCFPDINSFNLSFKDCIDTPREYGLKVLLNDFKSITIKTTAIQVFIIKHLESKMKKINLENTAIRCIWSMLDSLQIMLSTNLSATSSMTILPIPNLTWSKTLFVLFQKTCASLEFHSVEATSSKESNQPKRQRFWISRAFTKYWKNLYPLWSQFLLVTIERIFGTKFMVILNPTSRIIDNHLDSSSLATMVKLLIPWRITSIENW
jgi:hypothetical protein